MSIIKTKGVMENTQLVTKLLAEAIYNYLLRYPN